MTVAQESRYASLRRYNLIAAAFHAVQAGLVVALSNDFTLPVTGTYLEGPPGTAPSETVRSSLHTPRREETTVLANLIAAVRNTGVRWARACGVAVNNFISAEDRGKELDCSARDADFLARNSS